jgi:hypothetical protein
MILSLTKDFRDTAVNDEHGTGTARGHSRIKTGAVQRNALPRGLANGVLLGVNGPHAVLGDMTVFMDKPLHLMTDVVTMRKTGWGTNKTRDKNPPVFNNDTTALSPVACRSL